MEQGGRTAVTHVFGLWGVAKEAAGRGRDAERVVDLGRYAIHTDGPGSSGLRVLDSWELDTAEVTFVGDAPYSGDHLDATLTAQVWADALGHAQLHLIVRTSGGITEIAQHLQAWCRRRRDMRLQGLTLPAWFAAHVGTTKDAGWDQDVLQVVRLPDDLAARLSGEMAEDDCVDVTRLVYRNPDAEYVAQTRRLRTPPELNHRVGELTAHGRGVVVLGGHASDRVAALTFIGAQLLFALARVRRIRISVEMKLRGMRQWPDEAGRWLDPAEMTELSEMVRQTRIRLAVDVEAFADGIYMPEIVLDDFRRSVADALDLGAVLRSSSSMLDNLAEVVEAYRREAELLLAERRQELQRRWQRLATIASAVAIPLSLVFTFFGISSEVEVPAGRSIFDLSVYWPVWLLALLSVVAICTVSFWSSRTSSPRRRSAPERAT